MDNRVTPPKRFTSPTWGPPTAMLTGPNSGRYIYVYVTYIDRYWWAWMFPASRRVDNEVCLVLRKKNLKTDYKDLLVGHRRLIKNKTQTAIIFLILFPAPLSILYK